MPWVLGGAALRVAGGPQRRWSGPGVTGALARRCARAATGSRRAAREQRSDNGAATARSEHGRRATFGAESSPTIPQIADGIGRCHASRGEIEVARHYVADAKPTWVTHSPRVTDQLVRRGAIRDRRAPRPPAQDLPRSLGTWSARRRSGRC